MIDREVIDFIDSDIVIGIGLCSKIQECSFFQPLSNEFIKLGLLVGLPGEKYQIGHFCGFGVYVDPKMKFSDLRIMKDGSEIDLGEIKSRKSYPLTFNGHMLESIINGSKTQTRKILNDTNTQFKVGDRIWVREAWRGWNSAFSYKHHGGNNVGWADIEYKHDMSRHRMSPLTEKQVSQALVVGEIDIGLTIDPWRNSKEMPKWASRIELEIVSVRIERLHDISEDGARLEGARFGGPVGNIQAKLKEPYIYDFSILWEEINGYGSWVKNPTVCVIGFRRIK